MPLSLRYIYTILISVLLVTLAAGCISEPEAASADLRAYTMSTDLTSANLTYYTEQLPPYNYMENGTLKGISVDLLEVITEKMEKKVTREEVHLVPWAEGYQAALTRNGTVLFSMARTPEREQSFKWAGPIYTDKEVLFAKRDQGITIGRPEDLKGYRIGVITDDVAIQQLLDIGVNQSQLIPENNISTIITRLENGEIDLWACPEDAERYFTKRVTGNYYSYTVVYQLDTQDIYYAFNKDVPDSVVQSFQQALDTIKQEKDAVGVSNYERIIYRNLGVGCARQTFTNDTVMELVNTTATAIEKNASDTFRRINAAEEPYRNPKDRGLYVFVYDTNMTVVANADNIRLVGTNVKGKTDVTGKPYRDEIYAGAMKNVTGWVDYVYMHPVKTNLYNKNTYYRLTQGSDGNSYIVCSGNYKSCQNQSTPISTPVSANSSTNNSTVSPEELVAFVEKAFEYAHVHGQEAALREFNNQNGQFVDGELYIFAYDTKGTTLALPFQPEILGTNRWNNTDANGTVYIQDLISTAQSGGGFVRYLYEDPADNFTVKQKLSYVMMMNQSWIIGAGIYEPQEDSPIVKTGTDPQVRESLKSFVGEAIAYSNENGKNAAIAEFNDQKGTFIRGNLYVYAFDYNGTTLALPYQPQLIGTDLSGIQDPYGVNYTRVEIFLAQQGGGLIFYHYYNPARNMTFEPKMSYVQRVDENWWLGAGTYIEDLDRTNQLG